MYGIGRGRLKIAITGVQGGGKTTLLHRMAYIADEMEYGVRLVNEVARDCPFDRGTTRAQRWIWHEQYRREVAAEKEGCDLIICDRTLMDNLVYLRYMIENVDDGRLAREAFGFFYGATKVWMMTYDKIIRLPLNEERITNDVNDTIRPKSLEYARKIDSLFDKMIDGYVTEKR